MLHERALTRATPSSPGKSETFRKISLEQQLPPPLRFQRHACFTHERVLKSGVQQLICVLSFHFAGVMLVHNI